MKKLILSTTFIAVILFTGCGDKTTPETAKAVVGEVINIMAKNDIDAYKKYCSENNRKLYEAKGIERLTVPGLTNELTDDPVKMSDDGKTAEVIVKSSMDGIFKNIKTIWTLKDEDGEWKLDGDAKMSY